MNPWVQRSRLWEKPETTEASLGPINPATKNTANETFHWVVPRRRLVLRQKHFEHDATLVVVDEAKAKGVSRLVRATCDLVGISRNREEPQVAVLAGISERALLTCVPLA